MATGIGPIQLFVINFSRPELRGEIAAELQALRTGGTIRIVDSLGVVKGADGDLTTMRWSDLEETAQIPAGSVLGALLGLELAAGDPVDAGLIARAVADEDPDEDERAALSAMFEEIPPGGAAILLLLEHRWALGLGRAVRGAGGILTGERMIAPELLDRVPAVLAAAEGHDGR